MVMGYADPFETLFAFQRALENRFSSDWLGSTTASMGTYPPINVFQQDDNLVAIIELPGVDKGDLNIQAKDNTIRIAGQKMIDYPEDVSLHRRERLSGVFDRTLVVPMQIDPDGIRAEYHDGLLALFIPRPEQDKPRTIEIDRQQEHDNGRSTRAASATKTGGGKVPRGNETNAGFPAHHRYL